MPKSLSIEDIDDKIKSKVYTQNYSKKTGIEGVRLIPLINHVGEEGDLSEIIKTDDHGNIIDFPGFTIVQINRTRLNPKSIKAWHLHFKQDEIWYVVPNAELLVGLWDVRKVSPTKNATMRIVLGGGGSPLLYIPRGVAHGSANLTNQAVELFYFVNQTFNLKDPDEHRIPWDAKGENFWTPQRD